MTVEEVLGEILRDRLFFDDSGGGVTVSGGEPLAQPEFVMELLTACRAESVHTALDTCGFAAPEMLMAVAPLVDLFLYDVKALDDRCHVGQTGVSNEIILSNLKTLGGTHDNIWIRVPLIPGFNDGPEMLQATARFVASLSGVRQVNVLPYHAMGSHKLPPGGTTHSPSGVPAVSSEQLDSAAALFRSAGLATFIGG